MAKQAQATPEPVKSQEPEHVPQLPDGVQMHWHDQMPMPTEAAKTVERDLKSPPPGWQGSYSRCGDCGDFLGNADHCPACSPVEKVSNVINLGKVA